jgi:endonuclease/exonuclease/phosphatase family metal-dependent hydrolase
MTDVKIVTINTAKGESPYHHRLDLLAEGLSLIDPDIILLQESLSTVDGLCNTARKIGSWLGMHSYEEPARRKMREVGAQWVDSLSGLAILSRIPALETRRLILSTVPADGERIAQLATFEFNGDRLLIANTHLTHLRGRSELRCRQFGELMAHDWFAGRWDARIIGGDLNTPAVRLDELLQGVSAWEFRDTYPVGGGMEPRATIPAASDPWTGYCVDFILSAAPRSAAHPEFYDSKVILTDCDPAGVFPSDHRGVMTTLCLEGRS